MPEEHGARAGETARVDAPATGDYVPIGQTAISSLREIPIDANFKETQLQDLRTGQPAGLHVEMYGARHVFEGGLSGFALRARTYPPFARL